MSATPLLRCRLFDTGYCLALEALVVRGGRWRIIRCHAPVILLEHPTHGRFLWDSGYAPRMVAATHNLPYRLYRLATPWRAPAAASAVQSLARCGIAPETIQGIFISHFHADHIAGLRDFPQARFIACREAYAEVASRTGMAALRRAFIPALLPPDFAARAELLAPFTGPPLYALGPTHDVFGDGALQLVALPGHARGQMGALVHTERGRVLLAADGAWLTRAIVAQRPPVGPAAWVAYDARMVNATLRALASFQQACPDVFIAPTHCPATLAWFGAECAL